ncbi:hypothetical protein Clacol_000727 [Clathrus columnatus]|uniref:G-patch domain-containing protein n=1 Tax=Clathrus columnatus TaxID=1419009 RepID=A0AAV5A3R0_9AGAM|nr:hypothetical protein Clacol_000727 [Clathrus columnatus]
MPRRRGNIGQDNNDNHNNDGFFAGRGGRGGRGRGRGRGRGGRGRGGPLSNSNSNLNDQQNQPQLQVHRLQPDSTSQTLPQTQLPQQTQPQLRSQTQTPSGKGQPPLEPQSIQTSYTLDLFNNLSLNPDDGGDTVVFEGDFNDFTLGNITTNRSQPRAQSRRQQSSNAPGSALASIHTPQAPFTRGRGGPWRGGGWRGRPSLYGAQPLPFSSPFRKVEPNSKNVKGSGLGYAHPTISNPGPSPRYPKRPTTSSKLPRISLAILERDRPLLKPVVFVKGEHQTLLFKEQEEILHVPGEEKEHVDQIVPSADLVEKIFHSEFRITQAEEAEESSSKSETEDHTDDGHTPIALATESDEIPRSNTQTTLNVTGTPTIEVEVQRKVHIPPTPLPEELLVAQLEASAAASGEIVTKDKVETIEEEETGLPIPQHTPDDDETSLPQLEPQFFIISTDPSLTDSPNNINPNIDVQYTSTRSQTPLGVASDDEVVYEAPNRHQHPRPNVPKLTSTSTPSQDPNFNPIPLSTLPSLTLTSIPTSELIQRTIKAQAKSGLKMTPRMRRMIRLGKGTGRKGTKRKGPSLFALGLEREERFLESNSNIGKERKGMRERRRQGSDIDWGTEEDNEGTDEETNGTLFKASKSNEEIDFDPSEIDADINLKDLLRFVQSTEALSKGNGTGETIDDIEDRRKMDEEDEEEDSGSSIESPSDTDGNQDESENENFDEAERREIKELEDELSLDSSSSSEDFQTTLNNLRAENGKEAVNEKRNVNGENARREKGKQKAVFISDTESSEDDIDDIEEAISKAEEDERFLSEIRVFLDENEGLLQSHTSHPKRGKKKRKEGRRFKAIFNGSFEYEDSDVDYVGEIDEDLFDISYNSTKRDKSSHLPPGLKERWEQDRTKKAERKRERQLQREIEQVEAAMHVSPSGKGKLSKIQRKLLRRSAVDSSTSTSHISSDALRFEYVSSSTIQVSKITDLSALDTLIRSTFFLDFNLQKVILPPKDKQWRAKAHDLANAFYLKNKSEGREGDRFLTLSRTSMTGVGMREGKIMNILRRSGRVEGSGGSWVRDKGRFEGGRGGKGGHVKIRTRDGEEVGAAAPKIDSSNIGFQILEKMGWTEGQRIGITGGLADPLTAIIKTSKLGLGATR